MELSTKIYGKNWHLVYCKPRQENTAKLNLERQRYTVYLPLLQVNRRKQQQIVIVTQPLFPRYLFIQLDNENDNWAPIRSTLGVVQLVKFGQQAAILPDDLINLLRQRENSEGLHIIEKNFQRGERVQIADGAMQGYQALFVAHSSRDRVMLLLDILGKPTRLCLPQQSIEALTP